MTTPTLFILACGFGNKKGNTRVSVNMWVFSPSIFEHTERFLKLLETPNGINSKPIYLLTQMMTALLEEQIVCLRSIPASSQWMGPAATQERSSVALRIHDLIRQGVYPKRL